MFATVRCTNSLLYGRLRYIQTPSQTDVARRRMPRLCIYCSIVRQKSNSLIYPCHQTNISAADFDVGLISWELRSQLQPELCRWIHTEDFVHQTLAGAVGLRFLNHSMPTITIRYDSVYLTCSKKLTGSQLSPPHLHYVS